MIEMNSASAEIFIYGDITSGKFTDEDTSANSFVSELKNFRGKDVTVHVNSVGGDVFAALAIHNALKNYSGTVTATVDGVAASAASLIVCGADKVVMASNALMMVHMPAAGLHGYYTAAELMKVRDMLTATEKAIVDTYQDRVRRSQSPFSAQMDIRTMLESETWLNAREALKWGFADEVAENSIDMQIDNSQKILVVNSLRVDMKKFDEAKLRRAMEENIMEVKNETAPAVDMKAIREQEISRIRSLMKLRGKNVIVDRLIDVAIQNGDTVEEMQPYFDVADNFDFAYSKPANKIEAVIRDNMQSGAEGVIGSQPEVNAKQQQMDAIVNFANGGK